MTKTEPHEGFTHPLPHPSFSLVRGRTGREGKSRDEGEENMWCVGRGVGGAWSVPFFFRSFFFPRCRFWKMVLGPEWLSRFSEAGDGGVGCGRKGWGP